MLVRMISTFVGSVGQRRDDRGGGGTLLCSGGPESLWITPLTKRAAWTLASGFGCRFLEESPVPLPVIGVRRGPALDSGDDAPSLSSFFAACRTEGCFPCGTGSVDSWTPGRKCRCHRHPTGPLACGLPWTPSSSFVLSPVFRPLRRASGGEEGTRCAATGRRGGACPTGDVREEKTDDHLSSPALRAGPRPLPRFRACEGAHAAERTYEPSESSSRHFRHFRYFRYPSSVPSARSYVLSARAAGGEEGTRAERGEERWVPAGVELCVRRRRMTTSPPPRFARVPFLSPASAPVKALTRRRGRMSRVSRVRGISGISGISGTPLQSPPPAHTSSPPAQRGERKGPARSAGRRGGCLHEWSYGGETA